MIPEDRPDRIEEAKALEAEGRTEEAAALYRDILEQDPENVRALNNLGTIWENDGWLDSALGLLDRAISTAPEIPVLHYNRGHILQGLDRTEEAIDAYRQALALAPGMTAAARNLSQLLYGEDRLEEAAEVLRHWLTVEPESAIARHALAAVTGEGAPDRAADDYVTGIFDSFSTSYDEKMARLDYAVPGLLISRLAHLRGEPAGSLAILDAGCGTGLCAETLRPYARTLQGVDLSAGMLARARDRGLYDELTEEELTAALLSRPGAFDIVVSADTLIYFGDLRPALAAIAVGLRPSGHALFSVERLDEDDGFRLGPSGRYLHSRRHIEEALAATGLTAIKIEELTLRREAGKDVAGYLVIAER
ncbi:tetratricopeptide repeat protein [Inquilinus sp. CAU 1745]|uniref:tetratricopeptide repeat protein n=1 Tax=Inquilinus sp. CAU 1745 TaxID=3140369 RepID=UPI00325C045C